MLKGVGEAIRKLGGVGGAGILVIDDLVDTGQTAKVVREALPKAHFAAVYAKPMGRPMVDTFITEVSQDTWIHFPWDTGLPSCRRSARAGRERALPVIAGAVLEPPYADVAELVDARDLKSLGGKPPCRFELRPPAPQNQWVSWAAMFGETYADGTPQGPRWYWSIHIRSPGNWLACFTQAAN